MVDVVTERPHKIGDRWRVPDPLPESLGHLFRNHVMVVTYIHHTSENGRQQVVFYRDTEHPWGALGDEHPIDSYLLHEEMGWTRVENE